MSGSRQEGRLRQELLQEEIALMQHRERVAELRRSLPLQPVPDTSSRRARRSSTFDLLSPLWHLLDLTPEGRDDWYPSLKY